jgi:hypothetical protein
VVPSDTFTTTVPHKFALLAAQQQIMDAPHKNVAYTCQLNQHHELDARCLDACMDDFIQFDSSFPLGLDDKGRTEFKTEVVPAGNIGFWLRKYLETGDQTNLWLDIVGYDKKTFGELAMVLQVSDELLCEALLFK